MKLSGLFLCSLILCALTVSAPAQTTTTSFPALSGDGRVSYFASTPGCTPAAWSAAHVATDGFPEYTAATRTLLAGAGCFGFNSIAIARAFFAFDTTPIPQNAVITAAKLHVYITGTRDTTGDGFISVVQGTQSSPLLLLDSDFAHAGNAVTLPVEGSNRVAVQSIGVANYQTWDLNAAGLTWIRQGGYTLLAIREGHDILDIVPGDSQGEGAFISGALSESPTPPYLEVTYSADENADTTPPSVSITFPNTGQTVSGELAISANASDNTGVAGVQFRIDGVNYGREVTTAPYQIAWDTTNAGDGSHNVTAVARDLAGNTAVSGAVAIAVANGRTPEAPAGDTTDPSVSITFPNTGQTVSGNVTISANALDDTSVAGVQFRIDGVNYGAEVRAAPYQIAWDTTTAGNGGHTLTAMARDAAGNTAVSLAVVVTVANASGPGPIPADTTPPSILLTSPIAGQAVTGTVAISANASDNTGVAGVQFRVDGVNYGATVTTPPYQIAWDTTTAGNGSHTLTAVARDLAGNSAASLAVVVTVANGSTPTPGPSNATIVIDPSITHQTISGWEATAQAGRDGTTASTYALYRDHVLQLAVNDLGINRIRLEWRNSSGTAIDFAEIDSKMANVVKPMQQMMQARGERLIINLCYVGFNNSGNTYRTNPSGYASALVAVTRYLQNTYGIVPDYFEAILEPDNGAVSWSGAEIAANIAAAGDALVAAGFQKPKFIAPSTTSAPNAITVFDAMVPNAKALGYIDTISYHRYVDADAILTDRIAQRGATYGKNTAMLERIGKTYTTLHLDLKTGNNSAWQQYTLAYPAAIDGGAQYYVIDLTDPTNPQVVMGSRTKFLRQYFKFIRSGAVRVDATSTDGNFDPVAFRNTTGKYVAVINALAGGSFSVGGLPAGTYGIKYTTAAQYDVNLPDAVITAGQAVKASIPAAGAITIYGK